MKNAELLVHLRNLVKQERQFLMEILRHLRMVEERKLFLERGCSSMFSFCIEELGYSEPEAQVRIQAMRLSRNVPSAEEKLERGDISLTVAAKAQGCFRREDVSLDHQAQILEELSGASTREAERKLAAHFPEAPKREVERAVGEDSVRITFTATRGQMAKFQKLKELLAHKNFEGRYDLLFEELADQALAKINAPILRAPKVKQARTRYIRRETKRVVKERANYQCQYVDPVTQKRCESRHGLQIDHIYEYSKGGNNELENLQLLCGAHNRWKSHIKTETAYAYSSPA